MAKCDRIVILGPQQSGKAVLISKITGDEPDKNKIIIGSEMYSAIYKIKDKEHTLAIFNMGNMISYARMNLNMLKKSNVIVIIDDVKDNTFYYDDLDSIINTLSNVVYVKGPHYKAEYDRYKKDMVDINDVDAILEKAMH
jgi:GTPase SAR1 family protein